LYSTKFMFSKSTEYALRSVIYLAQHSNQDHKIGIAQIAKAIGSPRSFTAKVLQKLTKKNGIISSITGPKGGFYLTESSKKKSVLSVLASLEEDTVITGCVLGLKDCSEINPCPLHFKYKLIKPLLKEMFERKSIMDLANELDKSETVLNNKKNG